MKLMKASILGVWILISAGCASDPAMQDFPATAIPADEVAVVEKDMTQANADQLDVLAPSNFAKAQDALKDAKSGVKNQDSAKDILRNVSLAKAYLGKAREFAKVTTSNMSEVVEARRLAMQEGGKDAFASDFKDADDDLRSVASDIEENKTESAVKNRSAILAKYLDLEVRAIRRTALNEAEGRVNKAKKEGAEDWAPQSLALAEKSIKDADNYIIANRHDTARIKQLSGKALADSDRLLLVNKEAHKGSKESGERAALKLFAERDKVAAQKSQLEAANTQLNRAEDRNSAADAQASAAAAALATNQEFNKKFDQARAKFSSDEAEVYRQGENLVIRLKGLEFNSAKATLKGNNFPLLAKVQGVIGDLNAKSVVVEGHTDSIGSKQNNEKLSEARAEAVKSYLESNTPSGSPTQYKATGYGFQKPIASNKTVDGRAQNRRVDVVIQAQSGGEQAY